MKDAMRQMRAFQHSCGGWYAVEEGEDGFHHQPPFCVRSGWGRCWDGAEEALAAAEEEEEE